MCVTVRIHLLLYHFSMVSPTYSHICVFVFSSCTQILLSLFLSQSLSVCVFLCFLFAEHASSTSFWFSIYSTNLYIYLYIHIYISFSIFIIHVHVFSVFIQVYLITRCNIFSVSVFNKNFFPGFCFDFVYLTTSTTYIYIFHTFLNDTKATITCLCSHLNNQLGYIIVHTHTKCLRNSMQHSVMVASIYYYVTYKACTNNLWKKKNLQPKEKPTAAHVEV